MFEPGHLIGNYQVLSALGRGGMGMVYQAVHPAIGKKVALKVIHRDLSQNREVILRFFQEAKATGKIGSEHVVTVHDFGQSEAGDYFFIMEYLEGKNLAHVLATETVLRNERALHIGLQVADGLAAAHDAGIIHRDLKPDNVMLVTRGRDPEFVKILDFGLAKMRESSFGALTGAGVALGTPHYMSPEACESKKPVDHRTDIYALGVMLFQMLTGRYPFDGATAGEILVKQVTTLPPPLRAINSAVAPSVEQIVLRCLAKQPSERFDSMHELRDALRNPERYLQAQPRLASVRSLVPGEVKMDAAAVLVAAERARAAQPSQPPGIAGGLDSSLNVMQPTGVHLPVVQNRTLVLDEASASGTQAAHSTNMPRADASRRGRQFVFAALFVAVLATALVFIGKRLTSTVAPATTTRLDADTATARDAGSWPGDAAFAQLAAYPDARSQPGDAPAPSPVDAAGSGTLVEPNGKPAVVEYSLQLDSTPRGATVLIDGQVRGNTPLTFVTAGRQSIEFQLKGYKTVVRQINVQGQSELKVVLAKIKPAGSAAPAAPVVPQVTPHLPKPGDL